MNINVTSREALVTAAREIARTESLSKISIRRVASVCGISVGAIYNYFPTKSELMLAVIEDFWRSAFHSMGDDLFKEKNFCLFIKGVYERYTVMYRRFMRAGWRKLPGWILARAVKSRKPAILNISKRDC